MSRTKTYAYILILLFGIAAWAARSARPVMISEKPKTSFAKIPLDFKGWSGVEEKFDQATYDMLQSCSLLLRLYRHDSDAPVELAIVYGADLGDFHQPEFCLEGQGLQSVKKGLVHIKQADGTEFDAVSLIMQGDGTRSAYLYWFASSDTTSTALGNYKIKMFFDRLRARKLKPSAMIRLSTQVIGSDDEAISHLVDFADSVVPYTNKEFSTTD